jgi:hypothetical protein
VFEKTDNNKIVISIEVNDISCINTDFTIEFNDVLHHKDGECILPIKNELVEIGRSPDDQEITNDIELPEEFTSGEEITLNYQNVQGICKNFEVTSTLDLNEESSDCSASEDQINEFKESFLNNLSNIGPDQEERIVTMSYHNIIDINNCIFNLEMVFTNTDNQLSHIFDKEFKIVTYRFDYDGSVINIGRMTPTSIEDIVNVVSINESGENNNENEQTKVCKLVLIDRTNNDLEDKELTN